MSGRERTNRFDYSAVLIELKKKFPNKSDSFLSQVASRAELLVGEISQANRKRQENANHSGVESNSWAEIVAFSYIMQTVHVTSANHDIVPALADVSRAVVRRPDEQPKAAIDPPRSVSQEPACVMGSKETRRR